MIKTPETDSEILATARHNLQKTLERLEVNPGMRAKLMHPKEKIEWAGTPILSDGKMHIFKAFIVRHSDALGPSKGGIRMAETVTMDDVTGLATEMTWKTSLIGVPFGGGKAGIQFDSRQVPAGDKEAIVRSFTRGLRRHIGPETYVPAPDMGTDEEDMGHVRDCIAYSEGISITRGCFVTGKPLILGGIVGRREATGKGVVYAMLAACRHLGMKFEDMRIVVQGFGNVGSIAARESAARGATVVAAGDITGAVHNRDGLDIPALAGHVAENGGISGFGGGEAVPVEQLVEIDCDILVPAATDSQITARNADRIKAGLIAEGANAPTTPRADEIINKRNIAVIPDILCNAGGVFVSYLEYVQETQRDQMTAEQVETRLEERISHRFEDVYAYSKDNGLPMRESAMDMAVGKVVDAIHARGFLP